MIKTGTFIFTAILAATAFAVPADARTRHLQGSVQTQHGTYNGQSTVTRTHGSRTRQAGVTGPNGGQTSVYDQRTWGGGAYSHDRSRTAVNGATRTVDADAYRTAPGEWNYDRTVTGYNGQTRTQTGSVQVQTYP